MPQTSSDGAEFVSQDDLQQEPLATTCVVETIRTGQSLFDRVQRVCQHFGLTLSTANALAIIDGAGEPLSPHKIRERLLVTGGAVTQLLDVLERRELVRRIPHPTDRRSVLLEITEQGRRLRELSQPYLKQCDVEWMSGLTVEEQTTLVALLAKVQLHMANVVEPVIPQ
ncbi:MAG: MarR family transcriptional regulator [Roseiflexaceae bacterium]|nr:MarR family transcriptional regulator [Roseiflexaceae bacterium]